MSQESLTIFLSGSQLSSSLIIGFLFSPVGAWPLLGDSRPTCLQNQRTKFFLLHLGSAKISRKDSDWLGLGHMPIPIPMTRI